MKIKFRRDWPMLQYSISFQPRRKELWIGYGKNTVILDFWERGKKA